MSYQVYSDVELLVKDLSSIVFQSSVFHYSRVFILCIYILFFYLVDVYMYIQIYFALLKTSPNQVSG